MTGYKCSGCGLQWTGKRIQHKGLKVMPVCPNCLTSEHVGAGNKRFLGRGQITPISHRPQQIGVI